MCKLIQKDMLIPTYQDTLLRAIIDGINSDIKRWDLCKVHCKGLILLYNVQRNQYVFVIMIVQLCSVILSFFRGTFFLFSPSRFVFLFSCVFVCLFVSAGAFCFVRNWARDYTNIVNIFNICFLLFLGFSICFKKRRIGVI